LTTAYPPFTFLFRVVQTQHLTKACDNLLAGSLQSLLDFHKTTAHKMKLEDILEITEAIGENLNFFTGNDRLF